MLSYVLPTEEKPPPGEPSQGACRPSRPQRSPKERPLPRKSTASAVPASPKRQSYVDDPRTMIGPSRIENHAHAGDRNGRAESPQQPGTILESPKHNGTFVKKSTLHASKVAKDDSLYSIDSDASTVGSDRKSKIFNGTKHASLKRVSFGSSKGSMVETLVYETPVQEEPEINHFLDHNGRLTPTAVPVPDTDEGRERVRVSLLGPQPSPATPGVLLLEPIVQTSHTVRPIDMAASPAELLTAHAEHTAPAYHAQISTDSGWDNPFRPDGDLSREADEIVELIKGGKPITPTPGQSAPTLPGCEVTDGSDGHTGLEHDSSSSPLLESSVKSTARHANSSPRPAQENGKARATPTKPPVSGNSQPPVNEKIGGSTRAATVEVARMTAQGPGDASQVEHVTLKKKTKCKCCILQ